MKRGIWTILLSVGLASSIVLQSLILIYVFVKGGGTTGSDPVTPLFPFAVLLVVAIYCLLFKSNNVNKSLSLVALISALFGLALPFWLEFTGSLLPYNRLLEGFVLGTPRESDLITPLLVFAFVEGVALGLSMFISKDRVKMN